MSIQLTPDQILLDRYRLIEPLGKGGFSLVWLAEDTVAETQVAVKIYAPDKGLDRDGLSQFRKEYRRTRGLAHPHLLVPDHLDLLPETNSPFLVMRYCSAGSLNRWISQDKTPSEAEMASILAQVGKGLAYLHQKKILHQDIKPDNILIDADGQYLLTDFGISRQMRSTLKKATQNQSYMTMAYSPPERFIATPVEDPAGDVFSLGVSLYELCTTLVPWDGNGGIILNQGAQVPNLPESYSVGLNQIVKVCMDADYSQRPKAGQLAEAGKTFLSSGQWPALPIPQDTPKQQATPEGRKTRKMDSTSSGGLTRKGQSANKTPHKSNPSYRVGYRRQSQGVKAKWKSIAGIIVILLLSGLVGYFALTPETDAGSEPHAEAQKPTDGPGEDQPAEETSTPSDNSSSTEKQPNDQEQSFEEAEPERQPGSDLPVQDEENGSDVSIVESPGTLIENENPDSDTPQQEDPSSDSSPEEQEIEEGGEEEMVDSEATIGHQWMDKMAQAVLPNGSINGDLVSKYKATVRTSEGEMNLNVVQKFNFNTEKIFADVTSPMGQVIMRIEDGEGTMMMVGQNEMPMQPANKEQVMAEYYRNYIYLALKRDDMGVEYIGIEEIENHELVHIRVDGEQALDLYLDPKTSLPIVKIYRQFNSEVGEQVEVKEVSRDYRESSSVKLPYETLIYSDGELVSTTHVSVYSVESKL